MSVFASPPGKGEAASSVIADPILSVRDLRTTFQTRRGPVHAVNGISFQLERGKVLAIVGESGCGKSATAASLMRLVPKGVGRVTAEEIRLGGCDLAGLSDREMEAVRGRRIAMIFQEPMTALNPLLSIGFQICEPMQVHLGMSREAARRRAREMLDLVGIPSPEQIMTSYPHQLSGGMRQRVVIAMALGCDPEVLIADEPTTALDVTIQAQILEVLRNIQVRLNMAVILITHDLGVVAEFADDVIVMYAGRVVEHAPTATLLANPAHPYTCGLLRSLPDIDRQVDRLVTIPGAVPDPMAMPRGCAFHPRCGNGTDACTLGPPSLMPIESGDPASIRDAAHVVACIRPIRNMEDAR